MHDRPARNHAAHPAPGKGPYFREWREHAGYSLERFAKRAKELEPQLRGLSPGNLSKIERHRLPAPHEIIDVYARLCACTVHELTGFPPDQRLLAALKLPPNRTA